MAARDPGLGGKVEVRGRLVQEQDGRIDELGAGKGDQLALSRRKRPAPLGQDVLVAPGEPENELVGPDRPSPRLRRRPRVASGRP